MRRGISLIEVVVALAIALLVMAILFPLVGSALGVQERAAARQLASAIGYVHQQAVMRNVTYRVAFHLEEGKYIIESGDPNTLIFDDPEKRKEYEENQKRMKGRMTKRELAAAEAVADEGAFAPVSEDEFVELKGELPAGMKFGGVFTPQLGEMVRVGDKDAPKVVYAYLFPNGFAERTVIQLVEVGDEKEGYTLEIQPLTGRVIVHPEVLDPEYLGTDVPSEGPELP